MGKTLYLEKSYTFLFLSHLKPLPCAASQVTSRMFGRAFNSQGSETAPVSRTPGLHSRHHSVSPQCSGHVASGWAETHPWVWALLFLPSGSLVSFVVALTPQMAAYSTSTAVARLEVIEAGGKEKASVHCKQKSRKKKTKTNPVDPREVGSRREPRTRPFPGE